ncbi:MAG: hypothetical protein HQL07_00225 [Nitrospirae bacterium]|nr:hypothetical protein [Magnetococcales bacterium]
MADAKVLLPLGLVLIFLLVFFHSASEALSEPNQNESPQGNAATGKEPTRLTADTLNDPHGVPWDKVKADKKTGRASYNIELGRLLWGLLQGNTTVDLTIKIEGQLIEKEEDSAKALNEKVSYDLRELTVQGAFERLLRKHNLSFHYDGEKEEINIFKNQGRPQSTGGGATTEKDETVAAPKENNKTLIHTFANPEMVNKLKFALSRMNISATDTSFTVIDEVTVLFRGPDSIINDVGTIVRGLQEKETREAVKVGIITNDVKETIDTIMKRNKLKCSLSVEEQQSTEIIWSGNTKKGPTEVFWLSDTECGFKRKISLGNAVADTIMEPIQTMIDKVYRIIDVKPAEQELTAKNVEPKAESTGGYSSADPKNNPIVLQFQSSAEQKKQPSFPVVVRDPTCNGLIIYATNIDHIPALSELIKDLDQPAQLVEIEVMIVEAQKNLLRSLGTKLGGSAYPTIVTKDTTNTSSISNLFDGNRGDHASVISPLTSGASLGFLYQGSRNLLDATLSAFARDNLLEQVASPKVVVLNGKSAEIKSADQQSFRVEGSALTNPPTNDSYQTVDTGVEINITPTVVSGNPTEPQMDGKKFIQLIIHAQNSSVNPQTLAAFSQNSQTMDSVVIVPVNSTFIVGGLFKTTREEIEAGVPYLKEIPLLGGLFKENKSEDRTRETIFFITPRSHSISLNDRQSQDLASLIGGKEMKAYVVKKKGELGRDQAEIIKNSKLIDIKDHWQEDE